LDSIEQILKTIDDSIVKFQDSIPVIQKLVYDELQPVLKEIQIKDGRMLNSVNNLKLIGSIKNKLERIIINAEYKKSVKDFVDTFKEISTLQQGYFSQFANNYKPSAVLPIIQQLAVESTINGLLGQGMSASIIDPIQKIINQNITTGGKYAGFQEQLRDHILSNESGDGSLVRYTKQLTTDSINQFNAQYHKAIAVDLQFNWCRYVGSNITTSREFCIYLTKKQWIHRSEFAEVLKGHIDDHKCRLSNTTGLPYGMIPGTNVDNFNVLRGGYTCGHQAFWVPDSSVPAELVAKFPRENKKEVAPVVKPVKKDVPVKPITPKPAVKPPVEVPAPKKKGISEKVRTIMNNNKEVVAIFKKLKIPFPHDIAEHWHQDIKLSTADNSGSYFYQAENTMNIKTTGQRSLNSYYKEKILLHEGAHAMHFNKKIITVDHVDPEFNSFFNKAQALIKDNAPAIDKRFKTLLQRNKLDTTATEQIGIILDTLGSLTGGKFGGGHSVEYYTKNNGNFSKMEVFAHAVTLAKLDNKFAKDSKAVKDLVAIMKEYGLKVLNDK